jgi:hypothetical protein
MIIASSKDFLSRVWDLINTLRSFKFLVRLAIEKQLFSYIYVHNLIDIFTHICTQFDRYIYISQSVDTSRVVQKGPDHLSFLKNYYHYHPNLLL